MTAKPTASNKGDLRVAFMKVKGSWHETEDGIVVNAKQQLVNIPGRFLFPQIPTSKGQDVVVISGDKAGEVYLTRRPNDDGTFPLGRRRHKGLPLCTIEPSRLARCNTK